jgi:hypothetical protein
MITRFRAAVLAAAATTAALGIWVSPALAGSANAAPTTFTAATSVTNRDDSGTNSNGTTNNWATDAFTRTATITFHFATSVSNCPGLTTGICYAWTGQIKDSGTFTTVPGDASPGQGGLNGGPAPLMTATLTGPMTGTYNYKFYANSKAANASLVPASISGDSPGTGNWVEQFFAPGTQFWDTSGNTGGAEYLGTTGNWTYTLAFGTDSACPQAASKWLDGSAGSWGSLPADGNIFAPDASHC